MPVLTDVEKDYDEDDTDDKAGQGSSTPSFTGSFLATVAINIGGFNVQCMNYGPRMVLKLDLATAKFISAWVIPLMRELARSQAQSHLSLETAASESTDAFAGFQFCARPTPNIRDKVQWNPMKHCWRILVKKP